MSRSSSRMGLRSIPAEVPDLPAGFEDPENLSAGDLQAEAALDEIQGANAEVQGQVTGIIAAPVALVEEVDWSPELCLLKEML